MRSELPFGGGIQRRAPIVLLLVVSIVVLVFSLSAISGDDADLQDATFAPSLVAAIWLLCYLATSYLAFGTPYLFATAYIVCLFVFHFGLLLQDGFGLIHILPWHNPPLGAWAARAGWYSDLALACVGIGFSARALGYRLRQRLAPESADEIARQNRARLRHQGIGLLLAAALLFAAAIVKQGNIFALTRMQLFFLSDTRFISVCSMMAPSAAIALVVAAQTSRQRRLGYIAAAVIFLFFLISGQRSTAMFPLLVGAVVWVKTGRRINPLVAGAAIVGALLVVPVVGYLRTLGTYGEITSAAALSKASQRADIGAALGEMGGAIGSLIYTLKLIPAEEPYRNGRTYLRYLSFMIPNVGLQIDTSTGRAAAGLGKRPTKDALFDMLPGDWATFHIIPDQFEGNRGGAGFSGVAEPYFDFGLPGVLVFFIALGVFLGHFDCQALLLHRNWLLFGSVIYWHLLPTVRNGLGIFVKPAAFIFIALVIWNLVRRFVPLGPTAGAPRAIGAGAAPRLRSKQG